MRRVLAFVIVISLFVAANAQQRYLFNRYTVNDGLASNQVFCSIQDKMGFLWIGTSNGLQRFDGKHFVNVPLPGNKPNATTILQLIQDTSGNIFVVASPNLFLGSGTDVGILNPNNLHYSPCPITGRSTTGQGSFRLWKDSKERIVLTSSHVAYTFNRGKLRFDATDMLETLPPGWAVSGWCEDRKTGNYWFQTENGLALYDQQKQVLYTSQNNPLHNTLLSQEINGEWAFAIDNKDCYWITDQILTSKRLNLICFDNRKQKLLAQPAVQPRLKNNKSKINKLFITRAGQLWACGFHCLLQYDSTTNQLFQYRLPQPDNFHINFTMAYDLFEDQNGTLWLSTTDGLYFFNPTRHAMSNQILPDSLDSYIYHLVQAAPNEIWAGTWGQSIFILDTNLNLVHEKWRIDLDNWILSMCKPVTRPFVLVSNPAGEIIAIDPNKKTIVKKVRPKIAGGIGIRGITEDRFGNIWFSGQNKTVFQLPAGLPLEEKNLQAICKISGSPARLLADHEGNLYVGTLGDGIFVIDHNLKQVVAHYSTDEKYGGLSSNLVADMAQLNDSLIFVSSDWLDLLNIKTGKVHHLKYPARIPDEDNSQASAVELPMRAKRLALTSNGTLWFNNLNGIFSLDFIKKRLFHYGMENGFLNTANLLSSTLITNTGKIVFAGDKFVADFHPGQLVSSTISRPVVITELRLFDKLLPMDSMRSSKPVFSYNQNTLSFSFSSLSLHPSPDVPYYYRLRGASDIWTAADPSLKVSYTLLPPGDYEFEVYNPSRNTKQSITRFSFTIRPPFWKTWWFITIIILIIGMAIHTYYRQQIQKLVAVQHIRQRVARDLHDDMGSTLSSINILSSMAEKKLQSDETGTKEYISKIRDNTTRIMKAMNYIVWSINPGNDSMQKILARMRSFAFEMLEPQNTTIRFQEDKKLDKIQLDMEKKRDLFLIFKEAINNTAKYSHASEVKISLSLRHQQLQVEIQDNGRGFDAAKLVREGNGLTNMQKRALALKGSLAIHSQPGQGTSLLLTIPIR